MIMKARSLFGIPEERGTAFRVIFCSVFLALAGSVLYFTIDGILKGEMYLGSRWEHRGITFYRQKNPVGFWFATIIDIGMFAYLVCLTGRELIYAVKRKKSSDNDMP